MMTLMDKTQNSKYLRVKLNERDYKMFEEEAKKEHLSLATWARQKLLYLIQQGRAFNDD